MGTTLHNLSKPARSTHRKKRVGRGQSSGLGKTAGRGGKGQKARSGNMNFEGFEGGQMPLQRRLPKFGFKNYFRVEYVPVNVGRLETAFDAGAEVTPEALHERGVVGKKGQLIKVLGNGELTKKLNVRAHRFSASAKEAIEKAGGTAELIVLVKDRPEEEKGAGA
jgi:large subunit ribosomal protein L15